MRSLLFGLIVGCSLGLGAIAGSAYADDPLPAAPAEPALTISGDIARTNAAAGATLDLASFEALPQTELVTKTDWTPEGTRFTGVSLSALLDRVGIGDADTVTVTALNDYAVTIPVAQIRAQNPLLASRIDGETMSIRDKGPFWVIYPYIAGEGGQSRFNQEMVWQVARIEVH